MLIPLIQSVLSFCFFFKSTEAEADLDMIKGMIEDTLFSTQAAMVLNLKTSETSRLVRNTFLAQS